MLQAPTHGLTECIDRIDQLGIFPGAALRILELARSESTSLVDLERAVQVDAVLSARLLKVANSPLYGSRRAVGTLGRAIQMLGFRGTRDIATSLALRAVSQGRDKWGERLWRHSESVGWTCRVLAKHGRALDADALFVAGLLHDLGHQLLLALEPRSMALLLERFSDDDATLVRAEKVQFGFTHAELGAECLRRWNLPDFAADLVARHHEPVATSGPDGRARAILWLADELSVPLFEGASAASLFALASSHPARDLTHLSRGAVQVGLERLVEHRDEFLDG